MMLGLGMGMGFGGFNYPFQVESKTLFASLTGTYTFARKIQIDKLIKSLKTAGIWSKLDVLQMYAAPTAADAVINWKSPGTFNATLVNSPTLEADRGITGNGSSSYINAKYNPATQAVQYTLNNRSAGVYVRNNPTAALVAAFGALDGSTNTIRLAPRTGSDLILSRSNTNGNRNTVGTFTTSAGMTILEGNLSSEYYMQRNKSARETLTIATTGLPNVELFVLAENANGTPGLYSTYQVSCVFVGAYLGQTLMNTLVDTVETYLDYIGAGVIA